MTTVLLHKDVFLPKWVQKKVNIVINRYKSYALSKHVREHAVEDTDRSHGYTIAGLESALNKFFSIDNKNIDAFEVELTQTESSNNVCWLVTKICFRVSYSDTQDVCLSVRAFRDNATKRYDTSKALIVTAWLNSKSDAHYTLDASKYISEEMFNTINK